MKPLIAITVEVSGNYADEKSRGGLKLNYNYAERVRKAGGNPILVTPLTDVEELIPHLDGWLIPGRSAYGIYFYADNVEELAARLDGKLLHPPRHEPWGMPSAGS